MKQYLIDTNLLLLKLRQDIRWDNVYNDSNLNSTTNFMSVVTLGELHSLALQNNWGSQKKDSLSILPQQFIITDINIMSIITRYAEIDAFSRGKLKDRPLNMTSRTMGKNDLWIAATASIMNLTLLTTDFDFKHLHNQFIDLELIIL
jgi:tRNA(fMet)-specific endonuclease VapC